MTHRSGWGRWFERDEDDMDFAGRRGRGPGRPPTPPGAPPVPPGPPWGGGPPPPPWGGGPPWGPGGPWAGFVGSLFGRQPRARRGNVRAAILSLLAEQPRNGYQLMQELEMRSHGAWRPSSGSVYPTLSQLEDEGLVEESTVVAGGRTYKLTKDGEAYVASHADELRAAWDTGTMPESGDPRVELMSLFKNIASAAMQVFQHGTSEQVAEAKRLLNDTRRGLYRILAEDPADDDE